MKHALADFLQAAVGVARLTSTAEASLQKKLIAIAIDPVLLSLELDEVQSIDRGRNSGTIRSLLSHMPLKTLKKVSKKWNPHRPSFPREVGLSEVQDELQRLIAGSLKPTVKVVRNPPSRRTGARR